MGRNTLIGLVEPGGSIENNDAFLALNTGPIAEARMSEGAG
jgi:hypothetical protein